MRRRASLTLLGLLRDRVQLLLQNRVLLRVVDRLEHPFSGFPAQPLDLELTHFLGADEDLLPDQLEAEAAEVALVVGEAVLGVQVVGCALGADVVLLMEGGGGDAVDLEKVLFLEDALEGVVHVDFGLEGFCGGDFDFSSLGFLFRGVVGFLGRVG